MAVENDAYDFFQDSNGPSAPGTALQSGEVVRAKREEEKTLTNEQKSLQPGDLKKMQANIKELLSKLKNPPPGVAEVLDVDAESISSNQTALADAYAKMVNAEKLAIEQMQIENFVGSTSEGIALMTGAATGGDLSSVIQGERTLASTLGIGGGTNTSAGNLFTAVINHGIGSIGAPSSKDGQSQGVV